MPICEERREGRHSEECKVGVIGAIRGEGVDAFAELPEVGSFVVNHIHKGPSRQGVAHEAELLSQPIADSVSMDHVQKGLRREEVYLKASLLL